MTVEQLWWDGKFLAYLGSTARRHFSDTDDMKDAVGEVWLRLSCRRRLTRTQAERLAYRAINNFYDRNHRAKSHLVGSWEQSL